MVYTSNIWKLYVLRFFSSLIPAYVIERLYWEERGMTIQMVVYTEIIYALTIVLLEVPTGVIADKWGRKRMLVLSAMLGCAEFLILLFATTFWHFDFVVFLAGVSRSSSSGAENAMLYDSLMLQGKASSFEKQLGGLNACDFISAMLAALCGSLLASRFGLELNYWISLCSSLMALFLSVLLIEPVAAASDTQVEQEIPFKQYVAVSLRFFRYNPGVSLVVLSGMVTGTAMGFIDEFWQLYVSRIEIPVVYFGVLSAALMLLRLPGNLLVQALLSRFSYRSLLLSVTTVFAIGFTYAAVSKNYIGLAAMLIVCLFSGVMEPLVTGYLHHRIDSSMRATIDSFQSLGLNSVHILAGLGFGYFSSRYDVFGGYGFIALMCGAFLVWFIVASSKIGGREMRSENEMLDLILTFAKEDERVRSVIMNGSRADPSVHRDIFQDYDIVFIVSSVESFVSDRSWIKSFGELIIMQIPSQADSDRFAFLMLFTDGNRIDLTLYPVDKMASFKTDSLSLLLLDKDGNIQPFPTPSNKDYMPIPPTAEQFADCCNEFWWVSTYIAKGLWRRELPYAKFMYDGPVRDMLTLMLQWHIGIRTDFTVNPGKFGKYFEKHLEPEHWDAFVKTFSDAEYENIWQALFVMCDLFRETALEVANYYGYDYPLADDRRVTDYLHHVRLLPRDADGVY